MSRDAPTTAARRITVIAPVPSLQKRTRLVKFARCYAEAGYQVDHLGWRRTDEVLAEVDVVPGVERTVWIMTGRGYGGGLRHLIVGYTLWALQVLSVISRRPPEVVHALGLESALPVAVVAAFRSNITLIFDDADRMSLCRPWPKPVQRALQVLERWTARRASIHVAPSRSRYPDGVGQSFVALANTPSAAAVAEARSLGPRSSLESIYVLYFNGWIGRSRGAAAASAIADALSDEQQFRLVVAGRLADESAEELIGRRNVEYLGEVSNAEALREYLSADLALTFYDPAVPINRYAEPNKWGDCLAFGVPFLVNEEVETARSSISDGSAVAVPFDDHVQAIEIVLKDLAAWQNGNSLQQRLDSRTEAETSSSFDHVVRREILERLPS